MPRWARAASASHLRRYGLWVSASRASATVSVGTAPEPTDGSSRAPSRTCSYPCGSCDGQRQSNRPSGETGRPSRAAGCGGGRARPPSGPAAVETRCGTTDLADLSALGTLRVGGLPAADRRSQYGRRVQRGPVPAGERDRGVQSGVLPGRGAAEPRPGRSAPRGPARVERPRSGAERDPLDAAVPAGQRGEPACVLVLVDVHQALGAAQRGDQVSGERGQHALQPAAFVRGVRAQATGGQRGRDVVPVVAEGNLQGLRLRSGVRDDVAGHRDAVHRAVQQGRAWPAGFGGDHGLGPVGEGGERGRELRHRFGQGAQPVGRGQRGEPGDGGGRVEPALGERGGGRLRVPVAGGQERIAPGGQDGAVPVHPVAALSVGGQRPAQLGHPNVQAGVGLGAVQRIPGGVGPPARDQVRGQVGHGTSGGQVGQRVVDGESAGRGVVARGPGDRAARGAGQFLGCQGAAELRDGGRGLPGPVGQRTTSGRCRTPAPSRSPAGRAHRSARPAAAPPIGPAAAAGPAGWRSRRGPPGCHAASRPAGPSAGGLRPGGERPGRTARASAQAARRPGR